MNSSDLLQITTVEFKKSYHLKIWNVYVVIRLNRWPIVCYNMCSKSAPVSLEISRTERWVFGRFSWLKANSSTVETFCAFFRSIVPISRSFFTEATSFSVFFLGKLAFQILSSIAFGEIQTFNEHFIFVTEPYFGTCRNIYTKFSAICKEHFTETVK